MLILSRLKYNFKSKPCLIVDPNLVDRPPNDGSACVRTNQVRRPSEM